MLLMAGGWDAELMVNVTEGLTWLPVTTVTVAVPAPPSRLAGTAAVS